MAERLAASLLPAAASSSPSSARRGATVAAAAAASFPSSCPARAGLRIRSSRSAGFSKAARRGRGGGGALRVVRCMAASDAAQLKSAREDIKELLKTTYCHPILVKRALDGDEIMTLLTLDKQDNALFYFGLKTCTRQTNAMRIQEIVM